MSLGRKFLSSTSLILLIIGWLGDSEAKKLVIYVGPHETHSGTTSFLSTYAADDGSSASSFNGWSWPMIENEHIDSSPEHIFDSLVKEENNSIVQDIITDGIKSAWNASKYGVFIGSLDLDRVGVNPYSGYNPVQSLVRVVDKVGISTEDVTVIVTYRIPRVNQWGRIWKSHFDADTYEDFVCSKGQSDKRWEWLDTSMNPFKIAKAYHDLGWKAVVVDQDSIIKAGKDVANVVACLAMENKNCEDGKVKGLEQMIPKTPLGDQINELWAGDLNDLENLFLFRDCYYVTQLDDSSKFEMFAKKSDFQLIQNECKHSLINYYEKLSDTDFLMNAIQSQKYCEKDDINVPSFLAEMSDFNIKASISDEDSHDSNKSAGVGSKSDDSRVDSKYIAGAVGDKVNESSASVDVYKNDSIFTSSNSLNKRLVVFVGPHETEAVDVTKFFVSFASTNKEYESLESFDGWDWPLIDDEIIRKPIHRVFDLLVTDPGREELQSVIISSIVSSWRNSKNGVIIGSLDFDWVGTNPYSHYDPIGALDRVVDALGISREDVTIVVTYRSPRIDHWSVVWNNHFDSKDYEHFICSDGHESDKRWEWLDIVMNPFKISKEYYDQGFNVAVVDQEGTINAGMDVSHTIACELMEGVNCRNGWVDGLENVVSDPLTAIPMYSMEDVDRRNLEQIFRERDCYFKYELKDKPGFTILNQHSAWSSCSREHKLFYQQFTDTDFMLNLLKSQKQCGENNIDITAMLAEKSVDDHEKQMIVFAGPHETEAVRITKFFVDHASDKYGTNRSTSLDGWTWPIIDSQILGSTKPHRTFDLLLSDAGTRPIQNVIMDGIRDSWNNAQNGVIIGSLGFDRVGRNPYSNYDALGAIDRVMKTLGLSKDKVIVVLNYRSRRLDHLSAVWWNHFDAESFENFICSDTQADKRWEWMDTVMNPLKLANAYIEEGWNVTLVDQAGTSIAGKDVVHVVACDLMTGADCENGWIRGLESETIDVPSSYDIDDIDDIQRMKLEKLFLMRDCHYKYALESNEKFSTINRKEVWESCSSKDRDKFEKLVDTDFLLEVMRSLKGCGDINNLESSIFGNELLKSDKAFGLKSHSILIIASVFLSAICMILFTLSIKGKKEKRRKNAKENSTEGIFRDDPTNIDTKEFPYHDDMSSVDDTMNECDFDDNNGNCGDHLTENSIDRVRDGNVTAVRVDNLSSDFNKKTKVV